MKTNLRKCIGLFGFLLLVGGCSPQQRQISTLERLDHESVRNQLSSFRTSESWPDEIRFEKIEDGRTEADLPIPNLIADLDPWCVFVFPKGPPRIEYGFWVAGQPLKRDSVGLIYAFDNGEIPEGERHETHNFHGKETEVTVNIRKIADSTYLTTGE